MKPFLAGGDLWMIDAACAEKGIEADLFFPEQPNVMSARARGLCSGCPVWLDCLMYAVARPAIHGVWGGTTEYQRTRMRRMVSRAQGDVTNPSDCVAAYRRLRQRGER